MFKHIFVNKVKYYIRTKESFFWLLIFPVILATLFSLALTNMLTNEHMNPIHVAFVESKDATVSDIYKKVFESDSFNLSLVDQDEAKRLLKDEKVSGYIYFDGTAKLVVKENGFSQTVLKEVMDSIAQQTDVIMEVYKANRGQVPGEFQKMITENKEYVKEIAVSRNAPNTLVVYFYTVLAMTAMYGAMVGVYEIIHIQANQSPAAIRLNVAPVSKMKTFLSDIVAGCLMQFIVVTIVMLYIRFVLKIDFGNRYGYIALTSFVGSVTGISFGTFLGSVLRKGENIKVGIVIGFTMLCSFLAGMMGSDIKYAVKTSAPILACLNPVNLITESYYKLYYYDGLSSYWENILILTGMAAVFFAVTIWVLRRQTYDSI